MPDVDKILKAFFEKKSLKFFFLKDIIHKFRLKTKIRNKKEIGDDRIVNMIYAMLARYVGMEHTLHKDLDTLFVKVKAIQKETDNDTT